MRVADFGFVWLANQFPAGKSFSDAADKNKVVGNKRVRLKI